LQVSRVFSWQDKVYSKAELVAAQVRLQETLSCKTCSALDPQLLNHRVLAAPGYPPRLFTSHNASKEWPWKDACRCFQHVLFASVIAGAH
jgi:hypothetical protein